MGNVGEEGICCFCFRLKYGVFLITVFCFLTSLFALLASVQVEARMMVGGFDSTGRTVGGFFGLVGILGSIIGMLGINENVPIYMRIFLWTYVFVFLSRFFVFVRDVEQLSGCTAITSRIQPTVNDIAITTIAKQGHCFGVTAGYVIGWTIEFLLAGYFAWVTLQWLWHMESTPVYKIRFPAEEEVEDEDEEDLKPLFPNEAQPIYIGDTVQAREYGAMQGSAQI